MPERVNGLQSGFAAIISSKSYALSKSMAAASLG
jgi:hypothetical protein